jgi:hypothetical protein
MRFFRWGKRKDKVPTPKPVAQSTDSKKPERRPSPPKPEPWDSRAILNHLLALSPTEFEHAVARLLAEIGYKSAKRIGGSGDLGVDIVCYDAHGGLVAVQCKRYAAGRKVTSPDMQSFFGMMVQRAARQGIYVTTSTFTRGAIALAADRDIQAIDDTGVAALFAQHPAVLGLGPLSGQQGRRTSYERECRYCHRLIRMREMPDGKWLPFDDVEIPHDCRSRRP